MFCGLGCEGEQQAILSTRSCAALRAADLDWIVGPEYSLGGYIFGDAGQE